MIRGVGLDVVGVERFVATLASAPRLASRLFAPRELAEAGWSADFKAAHDDEPSGSSASHAVAARSLAARFAAKEALAKALGSPGDLAWCDVEVTRGDSGRPELVARGSVAARMAAMGADRLEVSLTHDAGIAAAIVIVL